MRRMKPPDPKEGSKPASRTDREAWEGAADVVAEFILGHRSDVVTVVDGNHRLGPSKRSWEGTPYLTP